MCRDWDGEMKLFNLSKSIKPSDIQHMAEIKTYRKVLDSNRASLLPSASSERPFTPPYLLWVCPGVYTLPPLEIVQQRCGMTSINFTNLMTPYFARHQVIQQGMLELWDLFLGHDEKDFDGYGHRVDPQPVTHENMLLVLHRIRNGINPALDPYPKDGELKEAHVRYQRYLETGNHIPLLVDDDGDEERAGSKRKAAKMHSDALHIEGSTKCARGPRASEAGLGVPQAGGSGTRGGKKARSKAKASA
ncbi:uncharacterized protein HD556DRAFT_1438740 [Suillus plorans]|uniref:Uncharacterized protein n=1 Tax=Suillus plorans TaxID=116603 RepID=A0A9P7J394_9AGAM|nr:uncharacterized protein HD556DRAFT_1438740 [Suillus plorans]KAG1800740.1 hypothetical protein HD556DRAFT_1438740 [Suillus plorans]